MNRYMIIITYHPIHIQEGRIILVNLQQEIAIRIIDETIKLLPYLDIDIKTQIKLRDIIEEQLNDYSITSNSTELVKGDVLEKAFLFLSCKKLEGMKDSTRYNYTLMFKKMNTYFTKPLSFITTMDLRLFLAKEYKGNQPNSLNDKVNKIRAFFRWLQDEGYITQNPARNLMLTKEPYRKKGHIESIDVEKMRESCKTIRDKALFEFLLSTGCRVSEVTYATIDKINWEDNSILVIGKGDKERKVFFSTRAKLFLMQYITQRQNKDIFSNSLFIASKKPYGTLGQRSIQKSIKNISERAGVPYDVHTHKLRHTFCQKCIDHKIPLSITQKLMGHESSQTTSLYYSINDNDMKQEYRKIAL